MAAYVRQRPASWFWVVGVMITLWGLAGCAAWALARLEWPPEVPGAPGLAYALAAVSVLVGGIALLRKNRIAKGLFVVALLASAGQLAWIVASSDMLAGRGIPTALLAAALLAGSGALVWFANYSRRHGWIM